MWILWGLKNVGQYDGVKDIDIKAEPAHKITRGGASVRAAVVDEGVDLTHPAFNGRFVSGYDATNRDVKYGGNTRGGHWGNDEHGTVCAGILASNGKTIGVAPQAHIIPIRAGYDGWETKDEWQSRGIRYAWDTAGAAVISCSWNGGPALQALIAEINRAVDSGRNGLGCIVVFSAGNNNGADGDVTYPSNIPKVIAVGAISPCGERKHHHSCDKEWWGSCYGASLSVMAPGVLVAAVDLQGTLGINPNERIHPNRMYEALPPDIPDTPKIDTDFSDMDYTVWANGTSSAAPHIAGVACLILDVNPDLTSKQVRDIIESTAQKVGGYNYQNMQGYPNGTRHNEMGYGLVNAYEAVTKAMKMRQNRVDLIIRDNYQDTGQEPNTYNGSITASPDIWVRNYWKNPPDTTHQEPLPFSTNIVYVRVKNIGNQAYQGTTGRNVSLYWAKSDSSLIWDSRWQGDTSLTGGIIMGGKVASLPIPNISAGGYADIEFSWYPPKFAPYSNFAEPTKFHLLARIEGTETIDPITFLETEDFIANARRNNNIAIGSYIVRLYCDNVVVDTKTFVKQ